MNHSASDSDYAIRVTGATVYLGGRRILNDINWEVKRGEHHFILGANGAGKTTLVKMLMGFSWPVYGAEIQILDSIFGQVNLQELRRRIAWVSPFLPQLTNPESTGLELALSGLDGTLGFFRDAEEFEEEAARAALARLRCERLADQPLYSMSSGEQVKVLIARALMAKPELVILDEASVYLDISSREYLLETVGELASSSADITVIFITQRIEDITPVFQKGVILHQGRIAACGGRDQVLTESNLSTIFDLPIRLVKNEKGRYWPIID